MLRICIINLPESKLTTKQERLATPQHLTNNYLVNMRTYQDEYIHRLQERAQILLQLDSEDQAQYPRPKPVGTIATNIPLNTKNRLNSRNPTQSDSDSQTLNFGLPDTVLQRQILQQKQEILRLKTQLKSKEQENQQLRRQVRQEKDKKEIRSLVSSPARSLGGFENEQTKRILRQELESFKTSERERIERKFKQQIEVWIRKVKELQQHGTKKEQRLIQDLKTQEAELGEVSTQLRIQQKKVKKLKKIVMQVIPALNRRMGDCVEIVQEHVSRIFES